MRQDTLFRWAQVFGLALFLAAGTIYAQNCAQFEMTEARQNFAGRWRLEHGGTMRHVTILNLQGASGASVTEYFDRNSNRTRRIEQTHLVCQAKQGIVILGFNPTDKDTGASGRNVGYNADNFIIINDNGQRKVFNYDDGESLSTVRMTRLGATAGNRLNNRRTGQSGRANAPAQRRCYDAAGLCYRVPRNWTMDESRELKTYSAPRDTIAIFMRASNNAADFKREMLAMLAVVAVATEDTELLNRPEEYSVKGMKAFRFSGDGYVSGRRVKWGFDIILAQKPTIILSLVDMEEYTEAVASYRSFFGSLSRQPRVATRRRK